MTLLSPGQRGLAFRAVVLALVVAAVLSFLPVWPPLVLAAWVAAIARPLFTKLAKATRGRHRAAGALVVLLVVVIVTPLALALVSLTLGAADLVRTVLASDGAKNALISVVSGGGGPPGTGGPSTLADLASPSKIIGLIQEHGAQAARILGGIAGAAAAAALGLFIFVYATYVFLIDGPAQYAWLEDHAPIDPARTRRLAAAFHETGRGLFVGVGLTGLSQGLVATITYVSLGVPRALVLGLITCFASLIPSVGTALIWVPVAIGLALAGKTVSALILTGVGVIVISTIDNVMRPVFARFGQLQLSTFVLLTSIFGGLAFFGGWGILLGPLFARLAKEALVMAREERPEEPPPPEAVEP